MDAYYWGMHGFGFMWIFPALFLAVLILLLVRGVGGFTRNDNRKERRETAREILDRRYASGEITKEQYDQMKRDINEP